MKSKYDTMSPSQVTDSQGNSYPDLATFPIESFTPSVKYRSHPLDDGDIYRFDLLTDSAYNDYNLYDDFTLWISDIPFLSDDNNFEVPIKLYNKSDIDVWYLNNLK